MNDDRIDADMRDAVDERLAARIADAERRRTERERVRREKDRRRTTGLRARHAAKLDRLQREANDMNEADKAEAAIEEARAALADAQAARPGPERVRALARVIAAATRAEAAIEGLTAVERADDEGARRTAWQPQFLSGDGEITRAAS